MKRSPLAVCEPTALETGRSNPTQSSSLFSGIYIPFLFAYDGHV
jgi:hypothetical protein